MSFSGHRARKRFGQHWLKDKGVLDKIVAAADLQLEDRVLEIGPGRGALTERLLSSRAAFVHAIELDRDLVIGLQKRFADHPRFSIKEGDVLTVPLTSPDGFLSTKVVANIPYNITGPIFQRLLGRLGMPVETTYKSLVILLQKEVADRILAKPGDSIFSALSVRLQLLARCTKICLVPPSSFKPAPKVFSEVIRIEPYKDKNQLDLELAKKIEILLNTAFLSRRKMLRNTLGSLNCFQKIQMSARSSGISLSQRPQDLSLESWIILAKSIAPLE